MTAMAIVSGLLRYSGGSNARGPSLISRSAATTTRYLSASVPPPGPPPALRPCRLACALTSPGCML